MTSHITASPSVFWFSHGNRVALVGVARASYRSRSAIDRWISPVPSGSYGLRSRLDGGGMQVSRIYTLTLYSQRL